MKHTFSSFLMLGALLVSTSTHAVPVFSSPECTVKGIVKDRQQRVEKVHDTPKVFNDTILYVLEQDYSNETERASASLNPRFSCNITNRELMYQLRDDHVTFRDPSLEKKLEGQCVQGHTKLSSGQGNALGIWLYDVEVLSPEECMVTASE